MAGTSSLSESSFPLVSSECFVSLWRVPFDVGFVLMLLSRRAASSPPDRVLVISADEEGGKARVQASRSWAVVSTR